MSVENKRAIFIVPIFLLSALLLASPFILNLYDDPVVLNITTEEDWELNSADVGWSEGSLAFDDGRLQIVDYGTSEYMTEYETHLVYRTRFYDKFDDEYNLDELRLEGYKAEGYDSGIGVIVLDCSIEAEPGDMLSVGTYCSSNYEEYDTGIDEESGNFVIREDIGDIEITGYPVVHINLVANQSETPDQSVENTYVNSLLLTRQ